MADAVDNDTLEAVRTRWQSDKANLPALVDEPPKSGRLKSPQNMPYAHIACEFARRELNGTGRETSSGSGVLARTWSDYRNVTITVWGTKADAKAALSYVLDTFHNDTELVFPSGARFRRWKPIDGGKLVQDAATKDGLDIWQGIVTAEVWSIRDK